MKLYFDSLTTLKVIHAESPIVIFFGTYGIAVFVFQIPIIFWERPPLYTVHNSIFKVVRHSLYRSK